MKNLYLTGLFCFVVLLGVSCKKDKAVPLPINAADSARGNYWVHVIITDQVFQNVYDTSYYQTASITSIGNNVINFSPFGVSGNNHPPFTVTFQKTGSNSGCRVFVNDSLLFASAFLNYYPSKDSIYAQYTYEDLVGPYVVNYYGGRTY